MSSRGVAEAQDQVRRGRHRGQIDVEQLHGPRGWLIECGQEALRAVPAHVFQGGVKGRGHEDSRSPWHFGTTGAFMFPSCRSEAERRSFYGVSASSIQPPPSTRVPA